MTDTFNFQGFPLLYLTSVLLYVTSVISSVFYITEYFSNQIFPLTLSLFSLFLHLFSLFFGFPAWFPLRIFFTFPVFPLHFPGASTCARPPNARVNIIMCMPFLCSSYIQEFYVLQHPYDSTL